MPDAVIRPARPDDAGALARIFHDAVQVGSAAHYSQAQRDDWSPSCPTAAAWTARLDGLITFVADDGGPVGFLSMEPEGYVDLLFVTPPCIGSGIAFALYRHALAHARALGLTRLTVEAAAQSRAFFARQGWQVTGTRTRGEGDAAMESTLMALDLG